jgi:cyclic pyranopterin phosphate synthase
VRSDITELIRGISAHSGITDLAMTTNGHNLPRLAAPLRDAGLRRVNISIDTLDPGGFRTITRGGDLSRVLNGIEEAIRVGLTPIKLNAVIMAGQNEDQLWPLIRFAQARAPAVELRFIEYMPFEQRLHGSIASAELRRRVAEVGTLRPAENAGLASGPARTFVFDGGPLKVGFISPLSEHFCAACNRLRLQSDGHLRTCLAHEDTPSLRDILRNGATDEDIQRAIRAMVYAKPDGHEATLSGGVPFSGVMTTVGG